MVNLRYSLCIHRVLRGQKLISWCFALLLAVLKFGELLLQQAVHRHIPILFRTIGSSSPELLQLIADPPVGSENLLLLVGFYIFSPNS